MAIRKQRSNPDSRPEWARPPLSPTVRAVFERRLTYGELATRQATKAEGRSRHRLEVAARNNGWKDPVREAVAEATRDEADPFGALVDLAEGLDIDVVRLLTATIATELVRREPTLKRPGRPALDEVDAAYLLCLLDSYKSAANAAASSPDPEAAAAASLSRDWAVFPSLRETSASLARRIKGRERAPLSVALEVVREEEPDLVRVLVGKRTATAARKRLRALSERDTEDESNRKWLDVKSRASGLLGAPSRG